MNAESTSFDAFPVVDFESMDVKAIRTARLKLLRKQRGDPGSTEFGRIIGKPPTQTGDLLSGRRPIGEKLARSIEHHAGLPLRWLDIEDGAMAHWPFSEELQFAVSDLSKEDLARLENVMRAHLGMNPVHAAPSLTVYSVDQHEPPRSVQEPVTAWPKKNKSV